MQPLRRGQFDLFLALFQPPLRHAVERQAEFTRIVPACRVGLRVQGAPEFCHTVFVRVVGIFQAMIAGRGQQEIPQRRDVVVKIG